ncbi:MAG: hypothetical protein HYU60_00950 [Magnetospirillum sp.]|nr:hypothetical protein [Magnetospirillum sp.]
MLAQLYRTFKKELDDRGIIFSFSGYLSEGILYSLGEALRQKMVIEDADITTVKKVFSVFVEQAQNIIRYSADKLHAGSSPGGRNVELSSGMIAIGTEGGRFFIVCANTMRGSDVPKLKGRLDQLQAMSPEKIKAFYKEQLREAPDEDSKGATIGLIEIARRASEPIQFDFEPADGDTTFFCLKVLI